MANSKKARRPFFVGMGDLEAGHWFFGPFKDDQAALDFAEWAAGRIALGSTFSGPHALLDAQVVEAEHERLVKAWLSYPAAERGPLPTISHIGCWRVWKRSTPVANADKPGGHFIISQLQLDLATVVARLEQLTDETPESQMFDFVLGRVLHCDLPRLRAHLEPELAVLVAEVRENFQGPSRG